MRETRCDACDKPIVFARDSKGKWQVLDPSPPVWDVVEADDGSMKCDRAKRSFVSHFVTCSDPNRFSRSRRSS
jgi:hypothetical protein